MAAEAAEKAHAAWVRPFPPPVIMLEALAWETEKPVLPFRRHAPDPDQVRRVAVYSALNLLFRVRLPEGIRYDSSLAYETKAINLNREQRGMIWRTNIMRR